MKVTISASRLVSILSLRLRENIAMANSKPDVALLQDIRYSGSIESVVTNTVHGWAFNADCPDQAVSVQLRVDNVIIGEGVANLARDDLKKAGFGNGCHGFSIVVDVPFFSGQQVELELYEAVSNESIAAIPFTLHCRDPNALTDNELDAHSVHGRAPQKRSRRKRQVDSLVLPILKPIRRMRRHYASYSEPKMLPGALAKLAKMDGMSVNSIENIGNWPMMVLPTFDKEDVIRPRVSVVIPAFNQFQMTYQCLTSLILSGDKANIEFLVVDDASIDATSAIESRVKNLRVVRNAENLGFLHSCNKAAAIARGEYVVFLNNDTEVEKGWIDQMLGVFARFSDVGAVGAKLIYPDGKLQDAGGIVWQSGQPWNVGHGRHRDDPEFNYVREVDYVTGAALMVSRKAWNAVEGFSVQYAPAYYEDTDLSFKLRDSGFRTLYCPQSVVVHYEGRSNGTDVNTGVKHHQVINAEKFKSTWKNKFLELGEEGKDLRRQKDRNRGLRVLMIDNAFPRVGQDAGSYAAVQELKLLLALNCKVTFLPHNLLHLGVHVEYLQRLGVECVHAPFHRSIEKFMEHRAAEFDVVYVTRYVVAEKFIPLVRRFSSAQIIFNNADLHFLREMRTALAEGHSDLSSVERTRQRELDVMHAVDVVLSYSDIELEIIASHLITNNKLFRCPWVLKAESLGAPFSQRTGISFLGGYAHPPNRAAVDWFIHNVMPDLRLRRPELKLHIWGSHLPDDLDWDSEQSVVLEGYAQSLDDVFTSTLAFIAPLQSGAGIKGKVLDSLAYGVPTILSPVAAEATGLIDGSSTLIAHSPQQWVEHIESLLDSQELWERLRHNSSVLRDERYSVATAITAFQKVFDYLDMDTTVPHQQVTNK